MKPILAVVPGIVVASVLFAAQAGGSRTLDIYVADTEGGKAALFVAPSGETVLVDSGNPGARDGDRIMAMIEQAGVKQIDHLISTHYHIGWMARARQAHSDSALHRSRSLSAPGTQGTGAGSGAAAAHSPAYLIEISASNDGTFTVTNNRNNFSKTYVKK